MFRAKVIKKEYANVAGLTFATLFTGGTNLLFRGAKTNILWQCGNCKKYTEATYQDKYTSYFPAVCKYCGELNS